MKRKIKNEEDSSADESGTKQPPTKKSRGKGTGPPWTEEQDDVLVNLYHEYKGTRKMWDTIYDIFTEKYPDANKTMKAMSCRYDLVLKNGTVELDDQEKEAFKKAVHDIDTQRVRYEAIAWRFGQISKSSKSMNKTAVGKLLKQMKSWDGNNNMNESTAKISLSSPGHRASTGTQSLAAMKNTKQMEIGDGDDSDY